MSSKRAIRRRACDGKQRHATQEAASRVTHGGMLPYHCRFCTGYHIGHPPRNIRQAVAARRGRS